MKKLDFKDSKAEIIDLLSKQNEFVVATCSNNRVTARTVYCTSNELKIYFVTSKAYTKYKQIEKNTNVALCFNNVQIEGSARILGHPTSDENQERLNDCPSKNEMLMHFSKYKNTVLIEVDALLVEVWKNNGREYLDVAKEESYRIG